MTMEATERAATARTMERQGPAQFAQTEKGPEVRQETQQEGGPGPDPTHRGAQPQISREEREKTWWEGFELPGAK
eukprot:2357567-Heterocapsa_arctica.AAC.1